MQCPVFITKEKNTYIAKELFSGIASQGKTVDEALGNLKEAVELYYEGDEEASEDTEYYFTTIDVDSNG